ncbi:metal-dependent hydrolase [Capnocytophaga canimorsus]|uniref:metal-dependent hydrolase n=1 Tax=Capnocytophaga canimorsus TaxID=28188 RepID=UPI0037D5B8CD
MDSLTQIVLGASIGETILGKKLGNKALLYGAIAGTIPDLDVFVGKLYDPITAITIHRGFSHSILFFLILSPVLGILLQKWEYKKQLSFKQTTLFWFLGLLTHALLDAFTTWGTQLFYPSDLRLAQHSIFVIDPLYTLPFSFCLIMVMRLKRNHPKRRKWNNIGLTISSCYLLITVLVQQIVKNKFENQLQAQNIQYSRKIVKPAPLNIILWNGIFETEEGYYMGDYSFFDTSPISFNFYPKQPHLISDKKSEKVLQQLFWISEDWWVITEKNNELFFNDIRFGVLGYDQPEPEYAFSYKLYQQNGVLQAQEVANKSKSRAKELFSALWERIQGK